MLCLYHVCISFWIIKFSLYSCLLMAMLPFPRVMHYYVTCNAIWKWCVAVFHHSWSIILKWISKVLLKTIKFNFTKWGNNRVWCMLVQHHNTIKFNIQNINLVWIVYKKVYYCCYQHIIMFVLSSILSLISAHVQHSAKKLVEELFPRRERDAAVEVTHCMITLQIVCVVNFWLIRWSCKFSSQSTVEAQLV